MMILKIAKAKIRASEETIERVRTAKLFNAKKLGFNNKADIVL